MDWSGTCGTSDWPGREKYIGKYQVPDPRTKNTFGYVYLIKSATGYFKIGSSQSVQSRIRQLQCGNPEPLTLVHQYASANAQQEERALHSEFAHRRVRNEWFALIDTDVASICAIGSLTDVY